MNIIHNNWNDDEIKILKANYQELSDEEMTRLIPRHSKTSIESKRKSLHLKKIGNKKYSFKDVKSIMNKKDYILISDETDFHNAASKIKYICKKHEEKGVQLTTLGHLLEGKGCYYCGREKCHLARRIDLSLCASKDKKRCEELDFTYIDTIRINKNNHALVYVKFICNKHKDYGEQIVARGNLYRNKSCRYCSHKNLPKETLLEMIKQGSPNIELLSSDFSNINDYVDCRCKIHDNCLHKRIGDLIKGSACYYCGLEKISQALKLSLDEINNRLHNKNPNIELNGEYSDSHKTIKFKCKKCGFQWEGLLSTVHRCPNCEKYYLGERNIREILLENNQTFEEQYKFQDCKNIRPLPFDFYLPDKNVCIEYQGRQHYMAVDYFGGVDSFNKQQYNDNIKRQYCIENNIELIEIPYTKNTKSKIYEYLKKYINLK